MNINNCTNSIKNINRLNNAFANSTMVSTFSDCVAKTLDNAAGYVIKSMPVTDHIKDVLLDVKNSFKSKELIEILGTGVKSSVREGLEILGLERDNINNIMDLTNVAKSGGLVPVIKNVIEIGCKLFTKNNIVGNYVFKFFDVLSKYVQSGDFIKKLSGVINRLVKRKNKFMENVNGWYKAYVESDSANLKYFSDEIKSSKDIIKKFDDCKSQSQIIANLTNTLGTNKLSPEQLQLCMQI